MEQKPRWNWVITLAAVFLAFCLGFGVARWTQHTDGVTVRTARAVPAQTESALPSVPAASAPTEKSTAAPTEAATQPPTEPGPLDLNRATAQELTTLPGIGEVLAQRIVDYREAHGPFRSVEELIAVEGIGEGKLEKLRELVTVEEEP